jgi:DNA-binding NtrC family response regulator
LLRVSSKERIGSEQANKKTYKFRRMREKVGNMPEKQKRRVFIVDDERVIASTLELILMNKGFDARCFADPIAALKAAQSESPDLLLTDVMMRQMTGVELAVRIRENCPSCKVLLFSGQVSVINLLAQAEANGHNFEFVYKPVHPAVLIEKINEVLQDT